MHFSFMRRTLHTSLFRRLTRFISLALVSCTVFGMHSAQAQMNHDASWATRSGWEANPARLYQQTGTPMMYLDAAYSGSKTIGFQQLMWKADASKASAVGSDLDWHDFAAEMALIRTLNPWMKAWAKAELDHVSNFERHWRKRGQWAMLDFVAPAGEVGISWELDEKSGEIRIQKRTLRYSDFLGYSRNEFGVEASFRRNIFKRVRGAFKLPLVNPKRIAPAGALWGSLKYDQLGFTTWFQNAGSGILEVKSLEPISLAQSSPIDLNSPRLWLILNGKMGYTAPVVEGWQWGIHLVGEFLQDEGERRYDRFTRGGQAWVNMEHFKWHWRAEGKLDRQSFRSLMADNFQWENKGEWWRWNLRSRLGYAISPAMQAVFTFEFSGIEAGPSGSESDLLGDWRGGNITVGIQWRQSSRSKWMPGTEDFNGLFMK